MSRSGIQYDWVDRGNSVHALHLGEYGGVIGPILVGDPFTKYSWGVFHDGQTAKVLGHGFEETVEQCKTKVEALLHDILTGEGI
jgi:hypothetical protein